MPGPVRVRELAAGLIDSLVRVRTKKVSLRLSEIGWEAGTAILVKVA